MQWDLLMKLRTKGGELGAAQVASFDKAAGYGAWTYLCALAVAREAQEQDQESIQESEDIEYDHEGRPILPPDLTDFERQLSVVQQGRGDPRDAGKPIGPLEMAARRLNDETLPYSGLRTGSGRPVGSSSSSADAKNPTSNP